jgi:light-independent protochlorophyllide reductase subunit B
MGFEGACVLFDSWVHPLMMGLEEHLIGMFRGDFEFHEGAMPSHLGHASAPIKVDAEQLPANIKPTIGSLSWETDAEKELNKIPFFVRGKAKRNTERYAVEQGLLSITLETLYDAKAHFKS